MPQSSQLLIRADAGGLLGTGHVMRMIALAQAWQDRGGSVTLASCQCPPALIERLAKENIFHVPLGEHPLGGETDLAATLELARSTESQWVVIDGYHFDSNYQKSLQENGFKVLAVDDYGHCETWHADLVLNQNLEEDRQRSAPKSAPQTRFLRGPEFALLRRDFYQASNQSPRPTRTNRIKLLITFGGVDPTQATLKVLRALNASPALTLDLRILAGPANPNLDSLRDEVAISPHQAVLIPACDDMPSLYRWADRVISAGGSSCYEWMLFGVPGWVTSVAANQDVIARAMLDQRLAEGIPKIDDLSKHELVKNLSNWLSHPSPKTNSATLVDGYGALRVASALSSLSCWVRPVNPNADARFLFTLANEPSVRSVGRHTSDIQWDEHLAWLQRHFESPESHLMIIEMLDAGPVGQVRFHHWENQTWEIGISISPKQRQAGLGMAALTFAMCALMRLVQVNGWLAEIRDENVASQRLFEKLGFTRIANTSGMQTWQLWAANEKPYES